MQKDEISYYYWLVDHLFSKLYSKRENYFLMEHKDKFKHSDKKVIINNLPPFEGEELSEPKVIPND